MKLDAFIGPRPTSVDRVGDEHHALSGRAKDIGSAAVFISLVLTVAVWAIIVLS
jgi:diacylglycerol kinase (ATP)